jgi:hypothetical protein
VHQYKRSARPPMLWIPRLYANNGRELGRLRWRSMTWWRTQVYVTLRRTSWIEYFTFQQKASCSSEHAFLTLSDIKWIMVERRSHKMRNRWACLTWVAPSRRRLAEPSYDNIGGILSNHPRYRNRSPGELSSYQSHWQIVGLSRAHVQRKKAAIIASSI